MNILLEDKYLLVCEKPAGMASQSNGQEDLVSLVSKHINGQAYIINRLDQPVGGLVLFAKDKKTAALLTERLQNNEIDKYYMAVVCGNADEGGNIESYLFHNKRENMTKVVNKGSLGAKLSKLEYTNICCTDSEYGVISLLKIKLLTGRHHQIRTQMASIGMGLLGDMKYNKKIPFRRGTGLGLYSCELRLIHPYTDKEIHIKIKPEGKAFDYFQGACYD